MLVLISRVDMMDQLSADQIENLRKTNTERLRLMAARTGELDDDQLSNMDRAALLQVVAEGMLTAQETEAAASSKIPMQRPDRMTDAEIQLEMRRMELEEKRMEIEARQKQIECENVTKQKQIEAECETRRKQLETEMEADVRKTQMQLEAETRQKELDLERENKQREHELNMSQAGSVHGDGGDYDDNTGDIRVEHPRRRVETIADRVKRHGSALKQVISPMSDDPSEIPQFFENLEAMYASFQVPEDLHAKLLLPFLSQKVRTLTARLTVDELGSYEGLKDFILSESKLTPREYKSKFDNATKRNDESFVYFTARLRNSLRYYLRSREVTNSFDRLVDLIIADKLKSVMSSAPLNYVLSLEGNNWFDPKKVAELADIFVANHPSSSQARFVGNASVSDRSTQDDLRGQQSSRLGRRPGGPYNRGYRGNGARNTANVEPKRCFRCNSLDHFIRSCPQGQIVNDTAATTQVAVASLPPSDERAIVSACFTSPSVYIAPPLSTVHGDIFVAQPTVKSADVLESSAESVENNSEWEFSRFPTVETMSTSVDRNCSLQITPLQYMDICVNDIPCRGLVDTGAQVTVISNELFDRIKPDICGHVNIQGIIGDALRAPLVNVNIKSHEGLNFVNVCQGMQLTCAVAPMTNVDHHVILPRDVVNDIQNMPNINVLACTVTNDKVSQVKVSEYMETDDESMNSLSANNDIVIANAEVDIDVGDNDENGKPKVNAEDGEEPSPFHNVDHLLISDEVGHSNEIMSEQHNDSTLLSCWDMAKAGKGDYTIDQGVLYHCDKVESQPVSQLCVPMCKRNRVMQLAHDSVLGGHLGERKTRERIRLSFYWPNMRKDIQQYVNTCGECQMRSRPNKLDRVPITPITRVDVPFQVMNIDCIGPIDPPSAQGHRYCLNIVDNCTRWPTVYVLKSLTARAVCDSLLDLFTNVGIPSKIISDNGSNFNSQLTRELLRRLGCSPVFATPGHPQASGLVERFNKSCKEMLYHVIQEHRRQWHKVIPLAVWALREVPNATTGVSPYKLVYGRLPRGPLAVLKESWTGQRDVKSVLQKPVEEYMVDLQRRLQQAADVARLQSDHSQMMYAHQHNLRSRDKLFAEGDSVIVLDNDVSGKLCKRWQGPATVVRVKSPHSYLVDMNDGRVRHVHANKMRKFHVRVQSCNVISESDDDFGRVLVPVNVSSNVLPSIGIEHSKIEHLTNDNQHELLHMLDEFADCFDSKPGLCTILEHKIQVSSDFQPKRMRPYRVPEIMKPEVERQIQELLDMGLIVRSNSPMASPLVCVAKKQGGIRLACDYRYVNSFTVPDVFPLATIEEVIQKVGQGCLISTFDAKSGYWQLMVSPECRWLTAFVTHEGLYEWVRMPFGLRNAGATFVRAITSVLQPLQKFSGSYVDDMAVGSQGWPVHMGHLRQFLSTIRKAGFTLNLEKCEFAQPEVHLLGHIVGSGTKRADPQRIKAITDLPRPTTKREIRRLLGALGYYRDYIPQFAQLAKPLTDLTGKNAPSTVVWADAEERAFVRLRQRLCSPPVLSLPDIGKPYHLHTDASGFAVAAALGQLDDQGKERPIAFASQKLTGSQLNWAIIEKEAYAIIWALNRFRNILYGAHITILSDHNPLQYIRECAPKSAKLLRWALALQEFDVDVKYTKGSQNVVADFLSRV